MLKYFEKEFYYYYKLNTTTKTFNSNLKRIYKFTS